MHGWFPMTHGLFDLETRFAKIDKNTDPLARLTEMIDWEQFRPMLQTLREKPRTCNARAAGTNPSRSVRKAAIERGVKPVAGSSISSACRR